MFLLPRFHRRRLPITEFLVGKQRPAYPEGTSRHRTRDPPADYLLLLLTVRGVAVPGLQNSAGRRPLRVAAAAARVHKQCGITGSRVRSVSFTMFSILYALLGFLPFSSPPLPCSAYMLALTFV